MRQGYILNRLFGKRSLLRGLALALLVLPLAATASQPRDLHLIAIGDSLTAGYNLPQGDGFPEQLEQRLRQEGYAVTVQNAGVSGDTTAMGLARLDWVLAGQTPDLAIVELGANDALRGVDPAQTRRNLKAIIDRLKQDDIPILLAGMMAPRNLGPDYVRAFDAIFPALAEEYNIPLYPFFLDGVIDTPELVQEDGLHPTRQGVAVIVEGILPLIKDAIAGIKDETASE